MTREDAGLEGPTQQRIDEAIANQAAIFKDTFPGMLGVEILSAHPTGATARLTVDRRVRHPGGYAHGGAIAGFGDTVAAWATFPGLGPGRFFTTIEFKTNFITGVSDGVLLGEATVVHKGSRTMVIDVKITTDEPEPRLVAVMLVTQAILRDRSKETPPDVSDEGVVPDTDP